MYNAQDLKTALSKGKKRFWSLHPKLNHFQISQLLTLEFYKRTGKEYIDYKDAFHYLRPNGNYYCYNGSAHLKVTDDKSEVTCSKCLERM